MITEIITIYVIIDDLLKATGHREDRRAQMSDAEVITAGLVAARFFSGNQSQACTYLQEHGWIPQMLAASRFSRRWHRLFLDLLDLFDELGMVFKALNVTGEYLLDSFPVALCDNIRIPRVRLVRSEDYRGYIASKKRYFYGIRVQLLCTGTGLPVEFVFLPGEANDTRGLSALPLNLPAGSHVYSDAGYTDYQAEDDLKQTDAITLQVMRKRNSKRPDAPWVSYIKQHLRHPIETIFSSITQRFPKSIHAVTMDGFLLKVTAFILAFTLEAAFIA
jgi:Transposase DDE domain